MAPFKITSQRFVVREKRFTLQYAQIYARRLDEIRPVVMTQATTKWPTGGGTCASLAPPQGSICSRQCARCGIVRSRKSRDTSAHLRGETWSC